MDAPAPTTVSANPGPRRAARLPVIDPGRCTGCGWCVPTCAPRVLSLEVVQWKKTSVLHEAERCTGCGLCAVKCPFGAITMRRAEAKDSQSPPDRKYSGLVLGAPRFAPLDGSGTLVD